MDQPAPSTAASERRSPTPAAARKRKGVRHLKQALIDGRFELHYQPIVSVRDGSVASVEALLRWKDPAAEQAEHAELAGLVWFVERSPVIFRLQDWALGEACQAAASWRGTPLRDMRVNVNVSAHDKQACASASQPSDIRSSSKSARGSDRSDRRECQQS